MISFSPNYDQQIVDVIDPLVSSLEWEFEMSIHGEVGDENTKKKFISFEQQKYIVVHDFYELPFIMIFHCLEFYFFGLMD